MRNHLLNLAALVALSALSACGGGSDSADGSTGAQPGPSGTAQVLEPSNSFQPGCVDCGAVSANQYNPSAGAGLWQFRNTSGSAQPLNVNIAGTGGRVATFILTNESTAPVAVSNAPYSSSLNALPQPQLQQASVVGGDSTMSAQAKKDRETAEFASTISARLLPSAVKNNLQVEAPLQAVAIGSAKTWTNCSSLNSSTLTCNDTNPSVNTTLVAQRITADGWGVNVWVADTERGSGKVTDAMANALADAYASKSGVHAGLTSLGGVPWGTHAYANLLSGNARDINLVVLNLTPDSKPLGLVGFFWSLNNMTKAYAPASNEALAFFLDSETAYLHADGLSIIKNTLSHEATHMRNFYQRTLRTGSSFALWLEEFTAMAAEELLAENLTPGSSPAVSNRIPYLMQFASSSCDVRAFSSEPGYCFGYAVGGSFGAYLLHNYGSNLLRNVLASSEPDSEVALTAALRAAKPGTSLASEVRRWHQATFGSLTASRAPNGVSYPAYQDSMFSLQAIDIRSLAAQYQATALPPNFLTPNSSHVWRVQSAANLQQTVTVPNGLTLSVVMDQ